MKTDRYLSRVHIWATGNNALSTLHKSLALHIISRFSHLSKSRNILFFYYNKEISTRETLQRSVLREKSIITSLLMSQRHSYSPHITLSMEKNTPKNKIKNDALLGLLKIVQKEVGNYEKLQLTFSKKRFHRLNGLGKVKIYLSRNILTNFNLCRILQH